MVDFQTSFGLQDVQDQSSGWSVAFFGGWRLGATDLGGAGLRSTWGSASQFGGGMTVTNRIKHASFGMTADLRFHDRGDAECSGEPGCLGHFGKVSSLVGLGYNVGYTVKRSKIQFEHIFFLFGEHDFDDVGNGSPGVCGVPQAPPCETDVDSIELEKGRELRFTFAQFLTTHMALKVEYRETKFDFKRELYNTGGSWNERGRAVSAGLVVFLY
jgi:hypothetical protein